LSTEPRYQLSLTYDQLCDLMGATADIEGGLRVLITRAHQRARATRKKIAECVHDYREFSYGEFCVKCGEPEPADSLL
jgi:hypothetical protein